MKWYAFHYRLDLKMKSVFCLDWPGSALTNQKCPDLNLLGSDLKFVHLWYLTPRCLAWMILLPRQHGVVSGESFDCHNTWCCNWHPVHGGQGCGSTTHSIQDSPLQWRLLSTNMSVVLTSETLGSLCYALSVNICKSAPPLSQNTEYTFECEWV